jgi:tetratricopeptide (TPR) repeat protein
MAERALRVSCWRCALAVCAAAFLAAPVAGQTLSEQLLSDARDGRLERFDFFEAALIASGVEDECELAGWIELYSDKQEEVLATAGGGTRAERLRALRAALHRQLLSGEYRAEASDLRIALTRGDFNCLSSLAIYFDLCRAADLDVQIWLGRGHVCLCAGDEMVIEPGSALWKTGPGGERPDGRPLTPIELLGKLYYNRGVGLLQEGRFAEGLELLEHSVALDPQDADARANLVAGLNNWAVEHYRARRYDEAAPLIEQGLRLDPAFGPLLANERLVRAKRGE